MPEELVVRHASPTLAGMKTANMFSYSVESPEKLKSDLRKWNKLLRKKGIRVIPLRYKEQKALIYIYRPNMLSCDLRGDLAELILREKGYAPENPKLSIKKLIKELENEGEFPHEIGLFLGYDPEDVNGYLENKEPSELKGYWKVYVNEEEKRKLFSKYKKCTKVYSDRLKNGKDFERMIVNKI